MVGGREMVVGRKSCLSFNDGRRKNSGWTMYEFEMCSSGGFERRVLCHVKRSSHCAYSGGTTIKTVETTLTEAATDTVTGDSFVGRKRNRDESSTLGKSIDSRRSHAGSWLHIPAEHCSRTSHHIQPRWCNPTSHHLQPRWCNPTHLPLSTLLHRTKPESQPPLHHQWTLVEVRSR
ncbi:unnamed protein product [Musa acuminata subsp. burmannicoides]